MEHWDDPKIYEGTKTMGSMGIGGRSERKIASKGVCGGGGVLAGSGLGGERDLKRDVALKGPTNWEGRGGLKGFSAS
jgi:hypothetical protein